MTTITIEALISDLEDAQKRASDITPIAPVFGAILQTDVDRRFQSAPSVSSGGTVYGGEIWPRVEEEYLDRNPNRRGGKLLRDTGELQQSFTIGSRGNLYDVNNQSLTFGSVLPKARGLDSGRGNPKKARSLIFAHDQLADELTDAYVSYIFPN